MPLTTQPTDLENTNQLATAQTPQQVQSGFSFDVPETIPSNYLQNPATFNDVLARGRQGQQFNTQFNELMGNIQSPFQSLFTNPDAFINKLLLNRTPTGFETMRDQVFGQQQFGMRDYGADIASARTDANASLGIPLLVEKLAKTREDYALREKRLDEDIKRLELNANRRGVAREFVDAERDKIKSDALDDLANLATIEKAQSGSLQEARGIVDDIMEDKKTAYELANEQLQSQINYLNTRVGEEAQERASQLQVALDERKARQDKLLAEEKEIRDLIVDVASQGGDEATLAGLNGALKSGNLAEALRLAGPWVGRLQREQAQASIRASNASAAKNEAELAALSQTTTGDLNIAVQALDSFSGSLGENNREQYTKAVAAGVKRGNSDQVELALKNAAQASAGSALREEIIKRDQAINSLRRVDSALNEYQAAGGDTNLLVGGYEDLQRKLGKSSDPKLAEIETRINLALNAYTNAVSGAAFTEQESARYASLFPSTGNTAILNTTLVDTLINEFEASNQVFYGNYYGEFTPREIAQEAVYQELIANASPEQLAELGITQ